jgi:hypothetical protein
MTGGNLDRAGEGHPLSESALRDLIVAPQEISAQGLAAAGQFPRPSGPTACSLGRQPQERVPQLFSQAPEGRQQAAGGELPSPLRGFWVDGWAVFLGLAPQAICHRPSGPEDGSPDSRGQVS